MNGMMEWGMALMAAGVSAGAAIYRFAGLPTQKQLAKVREWLLYAVTMAEKELGGGTGKIKLRYVYDWFLTTFPWLAKAISFEVFSGLVDEALEEMKGLLETNKSVGKYIAEEN